MNQNVFPLVACVTTEQRLANRIETAANSIGKEFYVAEQLHQLLGECEDRRSMCVVVDLKTAFADNPKIPTRWSHHVPTLALVPHGDMQAAFHAATIGAIGIIDDQVSLNDMARCLQSAFRSEFEARKSGRFDHAVYQHLSDREKRILFHLTAGEPNKRVASILDVGLRTVEAGRAAVMKKLHVKSFAELIMFVAEIEQERHLIRREIYRHLQATNYSNRNSPAHS